MQILLATLFLVIGIRIFSVMERIQTAKIQREEISAQLQKQKQINTSLREDITRVNDQEYLQELVREQLDLVLPGEKIFRDGSSG